MVEHFFVLIGFPNNYIWFELWTKTTKNKWPQTASNIHMERKISRKKYDERKTKSYI